MWAPGNINAVKYGQGEIMFNCRLYHIGLDNADKEPSWTQVFSCGDL